VSYTSSWCGTGTLECSARWVIDLAVWVVSSRTARPKIRSSALRCCNDKLRDSAYLCLLTTMMRTRLTPQISCWCVLRSFVHLRNLKRIVTCKL
jgi:hypothetical protein